MARELPLLSSGHRGNAALDGLFGLDGMSGLEKFRLVASQLLARDKMVTTCRAREEAHVRKLRQRIEDLQAELLQSHEARHELVALQKQTKDEKADLALMLKVAHNTIASYRGNKPKTRYEHHAEEMR